MLPFYPPVIILARICFVLCMKLEIVYVYKCSHSTAPCNGAELKFPGRLAFQYSRQINPSCDLLSVEHHQFDDRFFSEDIYSYNHISAGEICYTVACVKGRAVLTHYCCSHHPWFHGFFSQRWEAVLLFVDVCKSLHCGIPLNRWTNTQDKLTACNSTLLTEVHSLLI